VEDVLFLICHCRVGMIVVIMESKTVFTIGVHIFGVIENMHPRCSEEFENHNLYTVNTKDSKNCFAVNDHNNHSNSAVTDCRKRTSSTRLEQPPNKISIFN
jgi:hypothetical protein